MGSFVPPVSPVSDALGRRQVTYIVFTCSRGRKTGADRSLLHPVDRARSLTEKRLDAVTTTDTLHWNTRCKIPETLEGLAAA